MNISEIESAFSQDLAAFMEEKYGIDIDKVICEAIREVEDAEFNRFENLNLNKTL